MSDGNDLNIGFDRPKTAPLLGTVKLYHRHLLICTGQSDWPRHIDQDGGFGQALSEAVAARAAEMTRLVKITMCDAPSRGDGYDLLVWPDQVRYFGLHADDLPLLVEDHLVHDRVSPRLVHAPLSGPHILICTHGQRDARCGACGEPLRARFRRELEARGLAIPVLATSHVGGHEYAGNVLIYPEGDWYGYVTPDDVPRLIDQHLLGGQIVRDRWRGRMGLSREAQIEMGQGVE
jgi:hypothetical protein